MALSRRFLMICVVAISAVPTTASAAPIFWSQLQTSAKTVVGGVCQPNTGCSDQDDSGQQFSVDTLGPQTSTAQGATGGSATGFASVVDGVLHASASGVGGASFFDGWNASGQAIFVDTLTFVSSNLAPGTLVQLAFEIHLDYSLSGDCNPVLPHAIVRAQLHTFSFVDSTCNNLDVNNGSGQITVKIGDELPFQAFLVADAHGPAAGFADAANTFRFTIDPIGDFSYLTASGNSYLTPAVSVPEPASLLLVGTGLGSLVTVRYRRRRRDRAQS